MSASFFERVLHTGAFFLSMHATYQFVENDRACCCGSCCVTAEVGGHRGVVSQGKQGFARESRAAGHTVGMQCEQVRIFISINVIEGLGFACRSCGLGATVLHSFRPTPVGVAHRQYCIQHVKSRWTNAPGRRLRLTRQTC